MAARTIRLALFALLLAVTGLGCGPSVRPCKSQTLYLHIALDGAAGAADTLAIDVTLAAQTKHGTVAHKPGVLSGSVEVDFDGTYPANQTVDVVVTALADDTALGRSGEQIKMGSVCSSLSLTIASGVLDLGIDDQLPAGDGGEVDGGDAGASGPDLAVGIGAACLPGTCTEGICVDGVCCDSACNGTCEACDLSGSLGHCTAVVGTPHGRRPLCANPGTTCGGTCNGTLRSDCTYAPASTNCVPASCNAGVKVPPVSCDGAGSCPAPQSLTCLTPACSGVNCAVNCTQDSDCSSTPATPFCDAGSCTAHRPIGRTCSAGGDCNSGNCANGVCCNQACTGACQACNQTGNINGVAVTPGTCAPTMGNVCRPAADPVCDVAETCTGSSSACPADGLYPATQVCRASTGGCDPAEHCTGSSTGCPADAHSPASTVCANATDCLNAAVCDGTNVTCPGQTAKADGTACNSAPDICCTGGAEKCAGGVCKVSGCCNTSTCCRE